MTTTIICDYCNQSINNTQRINYSRYVDNGIVAAFARISNPAGTFVPIELDFHRDCLNTILEFGKLEPRDE